MESPSSNPPDADPGASFAWEASEFVHHDKPAVWYLGLLLGALVLIGVFVLLRQWIAVALVVVMVLAVWVYSRKEPRTLSYAVDAKGITIQAKLQPYNHFKSFAVHEGLAWKEIELEPAQRFAPRLTLLATNDNFADIETILAHHLPEVDRSHDPIERLARYIKF